MLQSISLILIGIVFITKNEFAAADKCGLETKSVFGKRQMNRLIVGGKTARPHSWPWQVAIIKLDENKRELFLCGGSIINRKFVLTAAHCVRDGGDLIAASSLVVKIGMHNLTKSARAQVMTPTEIICHEDYNTFTYDNDLALLRLPREPTYGKIAQPICMPQTDAKPGQVCLLTGWGYVDEHMKMRTDTLQEVYLPIVSRESCREQYKDNYFIEITDNMICAGFAEGGKDSCKGDSGGPLVCYTNNRWELQGIVSFGPDVCAGKQQPGIYARVTNFLPWISKNAF